MIVQSLSRGASDVALGVSDRPRPAGVTVGGSAGKPGASDVERSFSVKFEGTATFRAAVHSTRMTCVRQTLRPYIHALRAAREAGHGAAVAYALVPAFVIGQAVVIVALLS